MRWRKRFTFIEIIEENLLTVAESHFSNIKKITVKKDAARNYVNEEAKNAQDNLSFYTKGIDLKEMNLDGV